MNHNFVTLFTEVISLSESSKLDEKFNDYYFCRFDPDNEGIVRTDEIRFVMNNLPVRLPKSEIEEMIKTADRDGDGKITFEEFRRMMGQ